MEFDRTKPAEMHAALLEAAFRLAMRTSNSTDVVDCESRRAEALVSLAREIRLGLSPGDAPVGSNVTPGTDWRSVATDPPPSGVTVDIAWPTVPDAGPCFSVAWRHPDTGAWTDFLGRLGDRPVWWRPIPPLPDAP